MVVVMIMIVVMTVVMMLVVMLNLMMIIVMMVAMFLLAGIDGSDVSCCDDDIGYTDGCNNGKTIGGDGGALDVAMMMVVVLMIVIMIMVMMIKDQQDHSAQPGDSYLKPKREKERIV